MIEGGVFMWVILFIWLVALGICFYKFVTLRRYDVDAVKLFDKVKGLILQNNVQDAISLCSNSDAVLAKVLRAGLKRANEDRTLIEDAISIAILEHTPKITYQMSYISVATNLSTLFGLLGTIQGLIISFAGVATADPGQKAKVLAIGIATAMNTTALGLFCAITLMVIFAGLQGKTNRMNDKIDEVSAKLVDLLSVKQKKVDNA